jgi:hypothetical protein
MGFLARRRQRSRFRAVVLAEVERVRPVVEKAARQLDGDLRQTEHELAQLPGAAAHCPNCGERMTLGPVKVKRRWYTLWTCGGCRATYRPSEFPAESRVAGRQR